MTLQILSVIATMAAAIVAALATLRAKRIEIESAARLRQADQVHEEAKGIWTDAKGLREELRGELTRERERSQAREQELLARIEILEQRVVVLSGELTGKVAELEGLRVSVCVRDCAQRDVGNGQAGPPRLPRRRATRREPQDADHST